MSRLTLMLVTAMFLASLQPADILASQGAKPPTYDEMVADLGYTAKEQKALKDGNFVATDVKRTRDDQLVAIAAMRLPTPINGLVERVRRGENIRSDAAVLGFAPLAAPPAAEEWAKVAFAAEERDEARKLLKVGAGDDFNLASDEIEALQARLKDVKGDDPEVVEKVSAAYREVLLGRFKAYLEGGLQGIAPYDRGGKEIQPEAGLQAVYDDVEPFLKKHFPAFAEALAGSGPPEDADITSQHYWIKREVEGRTAFVLAHQLVDAGDGYLVLGQRQFFVGHTYESLQVVALALPVEGGSVVFYLNSAFTDKITGFFSGVAESVGQGRLKDDLKAYFETAQDRQQE